MNSELLCVSMAENGYIVEVRGRDKDDPAPKPDKAGFTCCDPEQYVMKTVGELTAFLDEKLPNLIPYDADAEYATAFDEAVKNE